MTTALSIAEMIEISRSAQQKLALFTQSQLDDIVKIIARTVYDHAELLARMAVDETRMGVYEDKVAKNRGKSKTIWNALKSKKSVGIIDRDEAKGLIMEIGRAHV